MGDPTPPIDDAELTLSYNRWLLAGPIVFLVLLASYPAYLIVEAGRRAGAEAEREAALVTNGRALWEDNCASCHGDFGEGERPEEDKEGAPALNSAQFLEATTDERIDFVISAGVPGTDMEAWWNQFGGSLTNDEIRALVASIRDWEATAPDVPDWREPGSGTGTLTPPLPGQGAAALTVTDTTCEPAEITVPAKAPFVLQLTNTGTVRHSVLLKAFDREVRVLPGQTIGLTLDPQGQGEFGFECFGPDEDTYVGEGVIKAV